MHHIDELVVSPSLETGERRLPELVTGARLLNAIQDQTFIHGGAPASVDGVKYDFRMGPRILKASFTQTINMDNLGEAERSQIGVDPGEVVFVMTQERLTLPANMIATLSPKRTLAHSGIIVLGGFAIDPNYSGALWMGLYNFPQRNSRCGQDKKLLRLCFTS